MKYDFTTREFRVQVPWRWTVQITSLVVARQLLKVSYCERRGQLLGAFNRARFAPSSALFAAAVASTQRHRCNKVAAGQLLRSIVYTIVLARCQNVKLRLRVS